MTGTGGPSPVQAREETLELKTYLLGPEDPNPPFQRRGYWPIYPYAMQDDLGEEARPVAYRALVIENEYLRVTVLPELGGHLHSALDKATGEDLFYHNHVVKPGLIALRGAWISGGIEWNFPRGHSVTTLSPVDARLVAEEDGSAIIWVGDVEQVYRMAWAVGIRLRPGCSAIETEVRLINRTPLPHPYYFWANAAVPARDDMRLIYPATRTRTWQGEVSWPIHEGRDLSHYRAFPHASDSFMLDSLEGFFGVYYQDRDFGVVHVADVQECFGKKYFTWGTAESGRIWASILSDDDGPYCEIQSGRFVDQSTWRLLPPHHGERWLERWFPVKGIGGFAWANGEAAVRLAECDGRVECGLITTRPLIGAAVRLSAGGAPRPTTPRTTAFSAAGARGERVVHEVRADLAPDRPLRLDLQRRDDWPAGPLTLSLQEAGGRELIRYTAGQAPRTLRIAFARGSMEATADTTGARLREAIAVEQGGGAGRALAAYEKVISADPACVEALVACGRLSLERDLEKAAARLSEATAIAPESGAAAYYLGIALRRLGESEQAEFELWRAAHSTEFAHSARVELGLIAMTRQDWPAASTILHAALQYEAEDTRARCLRAAALRRNGQAKEAETEVAAARSAAPLDRLAAAEGHFCATAAGRPRIAARCLRNLQAMTPAQAAPWIELSFDYAGGGLTEEAVALLEWAGGKIAPVRQSPLVHYCLAYWLGKIGRQEAAAEHRQEAARRSPDLVFPHHWDLEAMLRDALAQAPEEAAARYYLGTLLFSQGRREEGLAEWEQAAPRMADSAVLHRNLGLAYRQVEGNLEKAAAALRQAVACRPASPRAYLELDEVLQAQRADPRERLAALNSAPDAVRQRSSVAAQQIAACLAAGAWDRAIVVLTTHRFHRWEAEYRMRVLYVEAYLGRGAERFDAGDLSGARADCEAALEYPENLRVGRPAQTEDARPHWCAGLACEALGDLAAARAHWEAAEASRQRSHAGALDLGIYRALSIAKLGRAEGAATLLDEEIAAAQKRAASEPEDPLAHLTLGLGLKAAGRAAEAEASLRRALELSAGADWQPRARRLLERAPIF